MHAGIQNIHAMRDSLNALLKVCLASAIDIPKLLKGRLNTGQHLGLQPSDAVSLFWLGLADASWLKHIQTVMKTSMVIVDYVTQGHTVLVHCR
jgi:protein-tyrosine phosphatase